MVIGNEENVVTRQHASSCLMADSGRGSHLCEWRNERVKRASAFASDEAFEGYLKSEWKGQLMINGWHTPPT